MTFLPYHTSSLFLNLLSILPAQIPPYFRFLHPYIRSLTKLPRHTIVYTATNNNEFFATLNLYALRICRAGQQFHGLVVFWAGIITEATAGRFDLALSGRKEVRMQRQEDELLRVLPTLNEGFGMQKAPEMMLACYMLTTIIVSKADLEDNVLDSMMEAASAWTGDTLTAGLVCLSVLAEKKHNIKLPKRVIARLLRLDDLPKIFQELSPQYPTGNLLLGLVDGSLAKAQMGVIESHEVEILENILLLGLLDNDRTRQAIGRLLHTVQDQKGNLEVRSHLIELVSKLLQQDFTNTILQGAIKEHNIDKSMLEMKLQQTIEAPRDQAEQLADSDMEMQDAVATRPIHSFKTTLDQLPEDASKDKSFLKSSADQLFSRFAEAFILAYQNSEYSLEFSNHPLLRRASAFDDNLYLTFFIRMACSPYSPAARASALETVSSFIPQAIAAQTDLQALIPYVLFLLGDPVGRIRRGAAECLVALGNVYQKAGKETKNFRTWGSGDLYEDSQASAINWLGADEVTKLFETLFLPSLEEIVIDPERLQQTICNGLNGSLSSTPAQKRATASDLKKTLRADLLSFLCSHIVHTGLYAVKVRLLTILQPVNKVGTISRTKELYSSLEHWSIVGENEVERICQRERLEPTEIDKQFVGIVSSSDKQGIHLLASLGSQKGELRRTGLQDAAIAQLVHLMPKMKSDRQFAVAAHFFEVAVDQTVEKGSQAAIHARTFLSTVEFSTEILQSFLEKIPASMAAIQDKPPATKRRRTSHTDAPVLTIQDPKARSIVDEMTFVLELVDGSHPERRPELLETLFHTLQSLKHFKAQMRSGLGYLQSLVLGSLLGIVSGLKARPAVKIDPSVVRTDLLVDCVRNSDSLQVQNGALLLIASLASIAPEPVLHSVMPIFTFMGSSVLRQDDDYSAHVIDQTIEQVIPPLVQSLRRQKRDVVSGTSELLLSFTAAFEHIPLHRRLRLFEALITKLGPEDFLAALLAMLANRYAADAQVQRFTVKLAERFDPELQLHIFGKYLEIVEDTLKPKPGISKSLLGIGETDGRPKAAAALDLLRVLSCLLRSQSLVHKISAILMKNDGDASRVRGLYTKLLEHTLGFVDTIASEKGLQQACGAVLESLLSIPTMYEFIHTARDLLQRTDDNLRRKVIKLLEARLQSIDSRAQDSSMTIIEFLPVLTDMAQTSPNKMLKHAVIGCIDRISEQFGRKDLSAISAAAEIVSGPHVLGFQDDRVRVIATLCLASMIEVLGEAFIPTVKTALPTALNHLAASIEEDRENHELHNATYSMLAALISQISWILTGTHLDRLLNLSYESSNSNMGEVCDENRKSALSLLARKSEVKECFSAVERTWATAIAQGPEAVNEALDMLSISIEKHPKSAIVKNSETLASFFLNAFDLRRIQFAPRSEESYNDEEVAKAEDDMNATAIQMIYKLNDTTFRPLFTRVVEWAVSGLPKKDSLGRTMRLTTLFKFLTTFFSTLKSIVTGYASYILEPAVSVLTTFTPSSQDPITLWTSVLSALNAAFTHDQDDFFQSPSHFTLIAQPLLSQLVHASNTTFAHQVDESLLPAITSLAEAAQSPDHHKDLNSQLMSHLRSEHAGVRLAAVKAQRSVTEALGEEWLGLLPEMLPGISEALEDDDEEVEREVRRWVLRIEEVLGESLEGMLQ